MKQPSRELFHALETIHSRPKAFSCYTADELWTDEHTSKMMLSFHLNGEVDISSRTTTFIDRSAAWIADHFELSPEKSVADFGCGPGLYTSRFAATGAQVRGIDFSERSLNYARERSRQPGQPPVDYVHQSYLDYESAQRFDLITMIMCDFCALSPTQRSMMLERFHRHLKPGGALLLDVYSLVAFEAKKESALCAANLLDGFWSPLPYFGFMNGFKYASERVTLDKYTIIEEARTRVFYNWLQYFEPDSLREEIENSPLVVEKILGNVAGDDFDPAASEFAIVARKPN